MPVGSTRRPVLRLEEVEVFFVSRKLFQTPVIVKAVDGISLEVGVGEVVALVGESGSGKTTLGRAAIGLTALTSGRVTLLDGGQEVDVGKARGKEWRRLRRRLQIIFQDPFSSVDPNMRVYDTLRIPLNSQGFNKKEEVSEKVRDVLKRVGLPEALLANYVFQLSGGQRQRIGIARVLLFDPAFIVADEPVSMLDASLKADILNIFSNESRERGTAFLFITHEMSVARVAAQRIAVMYLGKIAELAPADRLIEDPLHPYSQALLQATPSIEPEMRETTRKVKVVGELALRAEHPPGCKFHPRCPYAMEVCKKEEPKLKEVKPDQWVACWLF